MRLLNRLWLVAIITLILILGAGFSTIMASVHGDEKTLEPFYGVSPELQDKLEQIALADSRVQQLVNGRQFQISAGSITIEDRDYSLVVGVRLRDDISKEDFIAWVKGGRHDSPIIDEYVGTLNIGYNTKYNLLFDIQNRELKEMILQGKTRPDIPEVSKEEKQRAVDIALADPIIQQILKDKDFSIAPNGAIGVWHTKDLTKLGVAFEIKFVRLYTIECRLPVYQKDSVDFNGEVEGIIVSVLLEEDRVATIIPESPAVEN